MRFKVGDLFIATKNSTCPDSDYRIKEVLDVEKGLFLLEGIPHLGASFSSWTGEATFEDMLRFNYIYDSRPELFRLIDNHIASLGAATSAHTESPDGDKAKSHSW